MMRGLYDIEVRPATFQELALVFREIRDQETRFRESLMSMGETLKNPKDLIDNLREELLPGRRKSKEKRRQKQGEYIRSLGEVDWSEHLSLDPSVLEKRKNQEKMEEELGPVVSN